MARKTREHKRLRETGKQMPTPKEAGVSAFKSSLLPCRSVGPIWPNLLTCLKKPEIRTYLCC